jgi:hypothetical protein
MSKHTNFGVHRRISGEVNYSDNKNPFSNLNVKSNISNKDSNKAEASEIHF